MKDENNGWDDQAPVRLQIQTTDGFVQRDENEWPLARTRWTRLYLDAHDEALSAEPARDGRAADFEALRDELTFSSPALTETTEMTGPVAAKLFVSSTTKDADLFLVLRVFSPDGEEVVFQGALDPHTPIGQGWLRASHRKLDPELRRDYRPYHSHDEARPRAGTRLRMRRRDLADVHRGARRLPHRPDDQGNGL